MSFLGLMTLLGKDSGGWVGMAIGGTLAALIGQTGAAIIGGALLVAGLLLVTGASTGAILRRTGHAVKRAGTGARRAFEWPSSESQTAEDVPVPERVSATAAVATEQRLLDGAEAYPDVVGAGDSEEAPLLVADEPEPAFESIESVFETEAEHSEYRLPDRTLLRPSPAGTTAKSDTSAKTADLLVRTLSEFGVEATVTGQISGPRVTRYELQLAPGRRCRRSPASRTISPMRSPRRRSGSSRPFRASRPSASRSRTSRRSSSRSATSTATCPRARARCPSGSARTSRATPCGPTWRACRTCSSRARRDPASRAASTRS